MYVVKEVQWPQDLVLGMKELVGEGRIALGVTAKTASAYSNPRRLAYGIRKTTSTCRTEPSRRQERGDQHGTNKAVQQHPPK